MLRAKNSKHGWLKMSIPLSFCVVLRDPSSKFEIWLFIITITVYDVNNETKVSFYGGCVIDSILSQLLLYNTVLLTQLATENLKHI